MKNELEGQNLLFGCGKLVIANEGRDSKYFIEEMHEATEKLRALYLQDYQDFLEEDILWRNFLMYFCAVLQATNTDIFILVKENMAVLQAQEEMKANTINLGMAIQQLKTLLYFECPDDPIDDNGNGYFKGLRTAYKLFKEFIPNNEEGNSNGTH